MTSVERKTDSTIILNTLKALLLVNVYNMESIPKVVKEYKGQLHANYLQQPFSVGMVPNQEHLFLLQV